MPKKVVKAWRDAVGGMARMGAAIGLISSKSQRKLAIRMPSGMATTAHQKNACAMRHQLLTTFPRRSYSVHNFPKAWITPSGFGSENGGRISQCVRPIHARITMLQLTIAKITLARGETSVRIVSQSLMGG